MRHGYVRTPVIAEVATFGDGATLDVPGRPVGTAAPLGRLLLSVTNGGGGKRLPAGFGGSVLVAGGAIALDASYPTPGGSRHGGRDPHSTT
jgi:hypothetical protein